MVWRTSVAVCRSNVLGQSMGLLTFMFHAAVFGVVEELALCKLCDSHNTFSFRATQCAECHRKCSAVATYLGCSYASREVVSRTTSSPQRMLSSDF